MKKTRYIVISLIMCLGLCGIAYAFDCFSYADYHTNTRGVVGTGTTETNSTDVSIYAQVAILDDDLNEYAFDSITRENPTYKSVTARAQAIDGTLTRGVRYKVQSYGRVDFMTKYGPDYEYDTDSVSFTFNLGNTRTVDRTGISDMQLLYQNERADYIFEKFGLNAGQYIYTWDVDVMQYVTPKTYTYMREIMDINPGDTSPSFFVDEENNTIYGVYQDTNAVNHLFTFCESENGEWYTNGTQTAQDLASYANAIGSFSEFEKSLDISE